MLTMCYGKNLKIGMAVRSLFTKAPLCQQIKDFVALIHPIQWTTANPVGADRPAKRQKKTSCVSTGRPVPVLCTRKVAHCTSFLSRQSDVIASFLFSVCTVQMCFQQSPEKCVL